MKKKTLWITLGAVAALLIALRLSLSLIVKHTYNRQFSKLGEYRGHIDWVGLSLWRGAYQIKGLKFEKLHGGPLDPFFYSRNLDISVDWKGLFQRRIVAKLSIDDAQLNFAAGPKPEQEQSGQGVDWRAVLQSLVPLEINRLRVNNGEIHFRDPYASPPLDLHLKRLGLAAHNLSSRSGGPGASLGSLSITATVMDGAPLKAGLRFNPFAPQPTFDYAAQIEGVELRQLNPFFLHYAGIDVHSGSFSVYSEAAAAEGGFKGYIKPMIKDLKVMKPDEPLKLGMLSKK